MKDETRNYVTVGVFVIVMVSGLLLWLAVLAGRTGATHPYYVLYDNVLGIKSGTQILFEGHPVGLIEDIRRVEVEGRQRFRVDLSVGQEWRIPSDSVARIASSGLLAAPAIDIRAGSSPDAVAPGGEIEGLEVANVFDVVSALGGDVDRILEQTIDPWLERITADTLSITENLERFTSELNGTLGQVNALISPANTQRVKRILENVEDVSQRVSALSAGLGQTRTHLDELLAEVDALLEENRDTLSHSVADAHDSLEAVARHVEAIAYNLEGTARNMNEFSRQIRSDPSLLLRGRDLGEELTAAD